MSDDPLSLIASRYRGHVGERRVQFAHGELRMRAEIEISSGQPESIHVRAELGPLPRIVLRREVDSDRSAKRWRLVREVQLGDPAFDDAVYVDARADDATVRHALARPEARAAVLALLRSGREVRLDENGLDAHRPYYLSSYDGEQAVALVEGVAALARALPPDLGRHARPPIADKLWRGAVVGALLGCTVISLYASIAYSVWCPLDTLLFFAAAILASVATWGATLVALFVLIRGRSDALGMFVPAAMFSLALCAPIGPALVLTANVALDRAPATEYWLATHEAHTGTSDDDPYVWVSFDSFREGEHHLDMRFEGSRVPGPSSRVHLWVRRGGLGLPWIEGAALAYDGR